MDFFANLVSTGDPIADVAGFLQVAGHAHTLAHCRAVAAQARELAVRFGLDVERANLAAACHDLAAVVPYRAAVAVAEALGLDPDPVERVAPVLLHGPIAAAVLRRKLNVTDLGVLNAVKYHTTSRAGASPLELLVFVADKIALDPRATAREFVPAVRAAAGESLERAAFIYLDWMATNGPRLGWTLHPNVLAAHAELDDYLRGSANPSQTNWRGQRDRPHHSAGASAGCQPGF